MPSLYCKSISITGLWKLVAGKGKGAMFPRNGPVAAEADGGAVAARKSEYVSALPLHRKRSPAACREAIWGQSGIWPFSRSTSPAR
ncbi:hypothetical protein FHS49_002969 [Sphingobium boeckii]|uniref:Uncharacterized protein n=1 Tax=Sphingobium boeckii TaxID=1082345 RepID=A0A7W9AK31_9SPHN|nr:hypothetical protein [Sphingobium boeckii]